MNERIKLSQHTAILLERARQAGISDAILLECANSGDIKPLESAQAEHYNYNEFISYSSSHGEQLERAIQDGYQITFNTFNGLQVWLEQRFGIKRGVDFVATEGRIQGLKLASEDAHVLKDRLANNWVMHIIEETNDYQMISLVVRGLTL